MQFLLSDKYKYFLKYKARVEFLEGVTYAGKTTVAVPKMMFYIASSEKRQHILAALDLGTLLKNIVNKENGIKDIFGDLVEVRDQGGGDDRLPHILYHTPKGDKIIYLLGYADKARWKKALGGQYGGLYIDEINTADMDFVREAAMRCDYMIGTLNPDDPNLPIYSEYINHSRELPQYENDCPIEILEELNEPAKDGWIHWFFNFRDNLSLTPEKQQQIIDAVPPGTKIYKNKIQGLRGKATGLIFSMFMEKKHTINKYDLHDKVKRGEIKFKRFTSGCDTAYSSNSPDTIAMTFCGITSDGILIYLDEEVYNNRDLQQAIAPSDTIDRYYKFLERNRQEWGFARIGYIDSADQGTIKEGIKFNRTHGSVYQFAGAYKKMQVIDRLNLQIGWLTQGYYMICDHCANHIAELNAYSWQEDKYEPEDRNDHTINSQQYAWLPFIMEIGANGQTEAQKETTKTQLHLTARDLMRG